MCLLFTLYDRAGKQLWMGENEKGICYAVGKTAKTADGGKRADRIFGGDRNSVSKKFFTYTDVGTVRVAGLGRKWIQIDLVQQSILPC